MRATIAAGVAALFLATTVAGAAAVASTPAILQVGVIRASDVPPTWQEGREPDLGPRQFRGLVACRQLQVAETAARSNPYRLSPAFADPANGGASSAHDTVYAFRSAGAATRLFSVLGGATGPTCLQTLLQRQVGNRAQVGPFLSLTGLQGLGDQALGLESVVQLPGQGTLVVDYVSVRVGRAFAGFSFANPGATIPEGPSIVRAVVERLTQVGA